MVRYKDSTEKKRKKRKENLTPWKQNIKEMNGGSRLLHSTVTP